ncbi:cupin domain-containing protein [uncultured Mailhella sp.]|uniref:cupin domain-containing protein n=1 Tax=uncultured Mailhella sp. TaxID=1981031 RepID=UPI0026357BC0|nr:cupin domain-containing protein [uncultured Mailhella sp.]
MPQYKLTSVDFTSGRTELHDALNLSGAEISINLMPAGVSVPFVHAHKQNEEVYIVLEGKGTLYIDGEELPLKAGDCFRIDPRGERCITAAADSPIRFICVQTKQGSLEGFTMNDGVVSASKASWL